MGVVTYGAVIVPILPQFHTDDIQHIIDHSESKLVFVGDEHPASFSPMQTTIGHRGGVFKNQGQHPYPALCTSEMARTPM